MIELERTPDVLGSMRAGFGFRGLLVGFAAETENLVANALEKLCRKQCDLVIANDVSRGDSGFDSDENEVILCFPGGSTETLPKQSKRALAREIIRRVVDAGGAEIEMSSLLKVATEAALAAGKLQRENFGSNLAVNEMLQHDIKLDLDVRCQELITGHPARGVPRSLHQGRGG